MEEQRVFVPQIVKKLLWGLGIFRSQKDKARLNLLITCPCSAERCISRSWVSVSTGLPARLAPAGRGPTGCSPIATAHPGVDARPRSGRTRCRWSAARAPVRGSRFLPSNWKPTLQVHIWYARVFKLKIINRLNSANQLIS